MFTALQCCSQSFSEECRTNCQRIVTDNDPNQQLEVELQASQQQQQLINLKKSILYQIESYCGKPYTKVSSVIIFLKQIFVRFYFFGFFLKKKRKSFFCSFLFQFEYRISFGIVWWCHSILIIIQSALIVKRISLMMVRWFDLVGSLFRGSFFCRWR